MRSLEQILRGIISFRHHYIMRIRFPDSCEEEIGKGMALEKVSNDSELVDGTYTVSLQRRIIKANIGKCDTFILKDKNSPKGIGILSVMYNGGNELEYRIKKIDAFIYNVMIDESVRGRGYAGVMINKLGAYLKGKGINEAYLAVSTDNQGAIRAYQKVGFETVAEKRFIRALKRNIPYYEL